MRECYIKDYSNILERDMEFVKFGKNGKVCFIFPELCGHYYDFKNFGLLESVEPFIEQGKIQIISTASIDDETWASKENSPRKRIELQEKWFHYIIDEMYPEFVPNGEKAMVAGCSMGGYHAANFFFRRPDLFDTFVSLSGLFDAQFFFKDYFDNLVYDNSPIHFLAEMEENDEKMDMYRKSTIITCVGQGLWEEQLLKSTRILDKILTDKNVPHWSDYWGFDVSHDWSWWKKQLSYFCEKILN